MGVVPGEPLKYVLWHFGVVMEHFGEVYREPEVAGSIRGEVGPFLPPKLEPRKSRKIKVIKNILRPYHYNN